MSKLRFIAANASRIMWLAFVLYMVMLGVFIVFVMGGMTLVVTIQMFWSLDSFSTSWMNMWRDWGPRLLIFWGVAYVLILPGFLKDVMKD